VDVATVEAGLVAVGIPAQLVRELIEAYEEAKRRYHLGDHRPQAVEGGRFAEAVFRVLQHTLKGQHSPLGATLPTVDKLIRDLANTPANSAPESLRLHIPRTLRLIYDIRNKRDAAHLADGIDPNLQDATLVVHCIDWVMAELVRVHHGVTADEAQAMIVDLVTKEVPAIQEIDGHPVILKELQPRDQALLMLYRRGDQGASELAGDLRVERRDHLLKRLRRLGEQRLILEHPESGRFHLTRLGVRDVENRGLAQPA
jgi:hypothetical protein